MPSFIVRISKAEQDGLYEQESAIAVRADDAEGAMIKAGRTLQRKRPKPQIDCLVAATFFGEPDRRLSRRRTSDRH